MANFTAIDGAKTTLETPCTETALERPCTKMAFVIPCTKTALERPCTKMLWEAPVRSEQLARRSPAKLRVLAKIAKSLYLAIQFLQIEPPILIKVCLWT